MHVKPFSCQICQVSTGDLGPIGVAGERPKPEVLGCTDHGGTLSRGNPGSIMALASDLMQCIFDLRDPLNMLHIWYFTWTRTRRSSQLGRKYYPVHTRPTVRFRCRNVLLQGSCSMPSRPFIELSQILVLRAWWLPWPSQVPGRRPSSRLTVYF